MSSEGSVEIKDLVKTYVDDRGRPTFTAVKNISLHIENGEFMVLVGPSGCGKSTTLRMVAGLEKITSGTISIGDRVVNELEPKDRGIAMVFQNYALYPHMTVEQNLAFGLQLRKTPKAEIARRVGEAAQMLGLEPYLKRKPAALSGGQRARSQVFRGADLRYELELDLEQAVFGTETEIKIAAFVEEGLSNPEIAARLLLSRRTVATHVSHILKKLDVNSRTDIAREAALRTIAPR